MAAAKTILEVSDSREFLQWFPPDVIEKDRDDFNIIRKTRADLWSGRMLKTSLPLDADTFELQYQFNILQRSSDSESGRPFRMDFLRHMLDKKQHIGESVYERLKCNRSRQPVRELLREPSKAFTVKIQLLETAHDIHRLWTGVPANLPLRSLQDMVMCPTFDWVRGVRENLKPYAFYMPATAYPSGFRPLRIFEDVKFAPKHGFGNLGLLCSGDKFLADAQTVDDSLVLMADLMHEPGHVLYYKHGFLGTAHFKITLQDIADTADGAHVADIQILSGSGMDPPEDVYIEADDGIDLSCDLVGGQAMDLALKWLRSDDKQTAMEAKHLLQLHSLVNTKGFNPKVFDENAAKNRLSAAVTECKARKSQMPISIEQAMLGLCGGYGSEVGIPHQRAGSCQQCGKSNTRLFRCSGCQMVWYCSKECQNLQWKEHKPACRSAKAKAPDAKKKTK